MFREGDDLARVAAESVARRSYGKLVAFLAARSGDIALAEDALADAFAAALASWPTRGTPQNPEAWLLTAARRNIIDTARRRRSRDDAVEPLRMLTEERAAGPGDSIPDDRLSLMFACAHPALDPGIRAPLMLQTVLGFDSAAIGSAFLVAPATMAQRLVRAKTKIRLAGIPFRIPESVEFPERLSFVLHAIYAVFAEGWSDAAGTETRRRNLAEEGIWLGRLVVSSLPEEPEAQGLLALMLHAEARRAARRDACGDYVPLAEQDPTLWDTAAIAEAEGLLAHASTQRRIGRYQLEAAIQSAHAARRQTGSTNWQAIEQLYEGLAMLIASPVVALNRAVVTGEIHGPAAGLAALDAIVGEARLQNYQPYWAARAELAARAGEIAVADTAYQRAIGLEADPAIRRFLQRRHASLATRSARPPP
jgi:RNA polymerase sigma-70 factor (ECF subfamily)